MEINPFGKLRVDTEQSRSINPHTKQAQTQNSGVKSTSARYDAGGKSHRLRLIVGLGNPGKEYEKTYHNVGFLYLDYLKRSISQISWQKPGRSFEYFKFGDFILVKPLTFINDSGVVVRAALKYFKCKPEELLVVHDDSDIELGKYKFSFGRGSAGHHGALSVIKIINTAQFNRLRIGIRKMPNVKGQRSKIRQRAGDLVLKKMSPADWKILQTTFEAIAF